MEKEYYIVEGDTRVGPLSMIQLAERGIEPSTLVWTAGMSDWARADCVPELAHLIANRTRIDEQESAFGSYARPEQPSAAPYQQQSAAPYQQPQQYGAYGNGPKSDPGFQMPSTNWKTVAIIATVCGFLFSCVGGIVGGFAIAQASKAENAFRFGDGFTARSALSACKTLCIVSFVLSGIGLIYSGSVLINLFSTGLL